MDRFLWVREQSDDSSSDEESSSSEEDAEMEFRNEWRRIKNNDPNQTSIEMYGDERGRDHHIIENMTYEDWEQLGHDISTNTHLEDLTLCDGALNDLKMTSLFRELTRSSSIYDIYFTNNDFGVDGVRPASA